MGLIELLISITVLALVLVGVARALSTSQRLRIELDTQSQARNLLGALEEDLLDGISAYALNTEQPQRSLSGAQLLKYAEGSGGQLDASLYRAELTLKGVIDIASGERNHLMGRYQVTLCYQGQDAERCLEREVRAPIPREINGGSRDLTTTVQTLALTLTAPTALSPDVEVQGERTERYTTLGSHRYSQASPGTLQVRARAVNAGDYSYAPSIVERGVSAQRSSLLIAYRALSGALSVTTEEAGVGVRLMQGATQVAQRSGSGTLPRLAPGVYTLMADPVLRGSVSVPAVVEPATVQILEGQTSSVTVRHPLPGASLEVTLENPSSKTPTLTLSGMGQTLSFTSAKVLSGLTPGVYSLQANTLSQDGFEYQPNIAPASVTLQSGTQARINVRYIKQAGRVQVQRTRPPAPYRVQDMTLSGPQGAQRLSGDSHILELPPGSYRLSAPDALHPDSINSIEAEVQPRAFTLQVGESRTVQVSYRSRKATLEILLEGPQASYTIYVSPPSGAPIRLGGPARLENLEPGNYIILAINGWGQFGAGPRNVMLAAGETQTVTYRFE